MLTRNAVAALVFGWLALPANHALAEEAAETAIRQWVASIDASPDWSAGFRRLSYDAASGRVELTGLTVASAQPGVAVDFGTITVSGYASAADGGFTATRITADGGSASIGPFKVQLADLEVNQLAIPPIGNVAWDDTRPFTSLMKIYAPIEKIAMTNGRIGAISLIEDNNGVKSTVAYDQFRIDRWAGGKIAAVTAGPLHMEAPDPDGLMTMNAISFEARDLDLGAALQVLDPDRYVGGVGDGVWHVVTRLAAYHDLSLEGPGLKLTLKLLSTEGFRLRQPPTSIAPFFDRIMANPDEEPDDVESGKAAINVLASYGIDRIGISGLDVAATGTEGIHLGGFNISDLSIDRLGEFALDDFAAAVADQGSIRIKRFAIGNVALPGADAMLRAMLADEAGQDVDVNGLVPRLGYLEASGFDFAAVSIPRTTLDSLRVDLADYIGAVPTKISADLHEVVIPVSLLRPDAQAVFKKLGYDEINLSYRLKLNWQEANETVSIDDLQVDLKGAGGLGMSMVLSGLPREAIENPEALQFVIPGLALRQARVTFKDDSIVGKGLDLLAEKMHAPPEKFRQQFADAMPLMLSLFVLNDPQLATLVRQSGIVAKLAPVVKAFVAAPGSSITVSLAPPTPVGFADITQAAEEKPETLIDILGFSVAGSGTAPTLAPPKTENSLRSTTPAQ